MINQTQKQFVLNSINIRGYVSRNECLKNYISRLGAIICILNKNGYDLVGEFVDTEYGKDYIYKKRKRTLF